jgi:LPXTG-motif cell wall-anchored protein
VLNWSPAAAPALANTGSDASGTLLIAGILLMLGAAVAGGSRLRLARR